MLRIHGNYLSKSQKDVNYANRCEKRGVREDTNVKKILKHLSTQRNPCSASLLLKFLRKQRGFFRDRRSWTNQTEASKFSLELSILVLPGS